MAAIHLIVDDLDAEIERLRGAGLSFRSDVVTGPGGRQILLADPAGNLVELFHSRRLTPWPRSRQEQTAASKPSPNNVTLPPIVMGMTPEMGPPLAAAAGVSLV